MKITAPNAVSAVSTAPVVSMNAPGTAPNHPLTANFPGGRENHQSPDSSLLQRLGTYVWGSIPLRPRTIAQRAYNHPLPSSLEGSIPSVSVIIPTFNRPDKLRQCIDSLLRQTIKPYEIIIVDDGDLDDRSLKSIIEENGVRYSYVHKTIRGAAASRNAGARIASGDIMQFVDDDIVLDRLFIENILKIYATDPDKEIGGVDGYYENMYSPSTIKRMFWSVFALYPKAFEGTIMPNGFGLKANPTDTPVYTQIFYGVASYRREVFDRGFFYDQHNYPAYSIAEDLEFAYRVSKRYKLVTTPHARYRHDSGAGIRDAFKLCMQKVHADFKMLALNEQIGLATLALMGWFYAGEHIRETYSMLEKWPPRKRYLARLIGKTAGIMTLPLGIPTRNALSQALSRWLTS